MIRDEDKQYICTLVVTIYQSLGPEEKRLIPVQFINSLKRYYRPEIAGKLHPSTLMKELEKVKEDLMIVTELLLYFGRMSNRKELHKQLNSRNYEFAIELLTFDHTA